MLDFNDIVINKSQLNTLLNHHEKKAFKYLLQNDVECGSCEICKNGVEHCTLFLNRFNDIKVDGKCTQCGNSVSITMAFGDNESFFRKAIQFRYTQAILIDN